MSIFYLQFLSSSWNLQTALILCSEIKLNYRLLVLVVIKERSVKNNIRTPSKWKF